MGDDRQQVAPAILVHDVRCIDLPVLIRPVWSSCPSLCTRIISFGLLPDLTVVALDDPMDLIDMFKIFLQFYLDIAVVR